MKQKIKICGAGLSGLTAAINLKKAGFEVEVFEANKRVGALKNNDWQGFENWTAAEDVLARVKACGLGLDFSFNPFNHFTFYSSDLEAFEFKSDKPIFYLVKRGQDNGCLDQSLKEQAEKIGVKILLNCSLNLKEADIVASGGRQPYGLGIGLNFDTDLEQEGIGILDDYLAPKGYAYFLAVNGRATIVSAFFASFIPDSRQYFERTYATFKKLRKFSVSHAKPFAGVIYAPLKPEKNKIYTGEAGGWQDYFLGFGMYHAIRSGFLAAKAIEEKLDYKKITDQELVPLVRNSRLNRFIFEKLGNQGYKILLKVIRNKTGFREFLRLAYRHNFSHAKALRILARYVQN